MIITLITVHCTATDVSHWFFLLLALQLTGAREFTMEVRQKSGPALHYQLTGWCINRCLFSCPNSAALTTLYGPWYPPLTWTSVPYPSAIGQALAILKLLKSNVRWLWNSLLATDRPRDLPYLPVGLGHSKHISSILHVTKHCKPKLPSLQRISRLFRKSYPEIIIWTRIPFTLYKLQSTWK